jgi:hypothetical protein
MGWMSWAVKPSSAQLSQKCRGRKQGMVPSKMLWMSASASVRVNETPSSGSLA